MRSHERREVIAGAHGVCLIRTLTTVRPKPLHTTPYPWVVRMCVYMGMRVEPNGVNARPRDESFESFVRADWQSMARLAQRLAGPQDWEDVLQDALALAWRRRHTFDAGRGSPRTWLLMLTFDQAGKRRRRLGRELENERLDDRSGLVAAGSHDSDLGLDVDRALRQLSARQRAVVELYYFLDLPVSDIAQVLSCTQGTVKSTLAAARAKLGHHFGASP